MFNPHAEGYAAFFIPSTRHPQLSSIPLLLWDSGSSHVFDLELSKAYLAPGGVRDQLLGSAGRITGAEDSLFVNSVDRPNTKRAGLLAASVGKAFKDVIRLAAPKLGLSADEENMLLEVTKPHAARHAVAGKLVAQGEMEQARLLLHHSGYDTLLKVYAVNSQNASTASLRGGGAINPTGAKLSELVNGATDAEKREVFEQLRKELGNTDT